MLNSCEFVDEKAIPAAPPNVKRFADFDTKSEPKLSSIGGGASVSIDQITGGRNILIIRKSEIGADCFAVFSAICPHSGYTVELPADPSKNIFCPEHDSQYDYYTGDMKKSPDTEHDFVGHLIAYKSEFNEASGVLRIYY
jgi:Rieske Fe-S protein